MCSYFMVYCVTGVALTLTDPLPPSPNIGFNASRASIYRLQNAGGLVCPCVMAAVAVAVAAGRRWLQTLSALKLKSIRLEWNKYGQALLIYIVAKINELFIGKFSG